MRTGLRRIKRAQVGNEPLVRALEGIAGARAVISDTAGLAAYQRMNLDPQGLTAVILPATASEAIAVLRACASHGATVATVGGGTAPLVRRTDTGRAGSGSRVLFATSRMRAVGQIDRWSRTIGAEAGATLAAIGTASQRTGYELPVDMSGGATATLGGAIASLAHGRDRSGRRLIADDVVSATLVAETGAVVTVGGTAPDAGGLDISRLLQGGRAPRLILIEAVLRLQPSVPRRVVEVLSFREPAAAVAWRPVSIGMGGIATHWEVFNATLVAGLDRRGWSRTVVGAGTLGCLRIAGAEDRDGDHLDQELAAAEAAGGVRLGLTADAAAALAATLDGAPYLLPRRGPDGVVRDLAVPPANLVALWAELAVCEKDHGVSVGARACPMDGHVTVALGRAIDASASARAAGGRTGRGATAGIDAAARAIARATRALGGVVLTQSDSADWNEAGEDTTGARAALIEALSEPFALTGAGLLDVGGARMLAAADKDGGQS